MNSKILLMALTASVLSAQQVSARQGASGDADSNNDNTTSVREVDLNPVVVTGNGHHQLLKSTTTPVHVISQKLIKETGVTDFTEAMTRLMPQMSFSPNAMGSYVRLNGLGNKYILILVNGKKLSGDIAGNVDLHRINMSSVKRVEVLDGAASSLYGSDAIGGVINIITEQKNLETVNISTDTRISGKGQFTQGVNLDLTSDIISSHTSFAHEEADHYFRNRYEADDDGNLTETIGNYVMGYNSNVINQRFDLNPLKNLSFYAGASYNYKLTDRPDSREDISGGSDYDMRSEGWRWEAGGKYDFGKHSIQLDFVNDNYHYGNLYQVATKNYEVGQWTRSKSQKYYDTELKGIFHFYDKGTTIIGGDWRNDFLNATSGNVNNHVYTLAAYLQHDTEILRNLSATLGVRYTKHGTFGNNVTPKVSLMYAPGNFRFRASFSQGYRAPGLDELYYHYFKLMGKRPVITFGNKDLNAEKSQYASISAAYSNEVFSVSVMGYINFVKDMIVKQNIEVDDDVRTMLAGEFPEVTTEQLNAMKTYGRYINSDKGIVKGVQANASVNLFDGFSLMANYAYTYGRSKSEGVWTALERTYKHSLTAAANYNKTWGLYTLNVNLNGRFQSRTFYPDYEDAPGYGLINLNTTHTFDCNKWFTVAPSVGVDNILDKVDNRVDTSLRKYALYTPGRMLVVGLKLNFKK